MIDNNLPRVRVDALTTDDACVGITSRAQTAIVGKRFSLKFHHRIGSVPRYTEAAARKKDVTSSSTMPCRPFYSSVATKKVFVESSRSTSPSVSPRSVNCGSDSNDISCRRISPSEMISFRILGSNVFARRTRGVLILVEYDKSLSCIFLATGARTESSIDVCPSRCNIKR